MSRKLLPLAVGLLTTSAVAAVPIHNPYLKAGAFIQGYNVSGGDDFELNHQAYFKRARLFFVGNLTRGISYKLEYDFAFQGDFKNIWLNYKGKHQNVRIGQLKAPFNSVYNQAAQFNWFNEFALPVKAFFPGFRRGLSYHFLQSRWNVAASAFLPGSQTQVRWAGPVGSTQRLLFEPWNSTGKVMQFGLSNWYQRIEGNQTSFGSIPEAAGYQSIKTVNTGKINEVDTFDALELESLFERNRFASELGFIYNTVPRKRASTLHFYGGYGQASYFLTKNTLNYNGLWGTFGSPKQMKAAYQLAVRLSGLNLNDDDVRGGEEYNTTLGLNVYMWQYVKFGFNYIYAHVEKSTQTRNGHDDIFFTNLQIFV